MEKRIFTPDNIKALKKNEVFVFGSNEAGVHGAGAAKKALDFGALYGVGVGLQGQTYAIPTKDLIVRTLPISEIKTYVDECIEFAKKNKNLTFLVTKIGCGLAGYEVEDIAPLFKKALDIENIVLPEDFVKYLTR